MSNESKEKIATARLKNVGVVDIYYIGGSVFEFTTPDGKKSRLKKDAMDKLVANDMVKITAPSRYEEIQSSILPDGSTKTHNADGTIKSHRSMVLDELSADGFIENKPNENTTNNSRIDAHRKPRNRNRRNPASGNKKNTQQNNKNDDNSATASNNVDNQPKVNADNASESQSDAATPLFNKIPDENTSSPINDAENGSQPKKMTRVERRRAAEAAAARAAEGGYDQDPFAEDFNSSEPFNDEQGYDNYQQQPTRNNQQPIRNEVPGDINGDGVVDEFDALVRNEQKTTPSVITAIVLFFILSLFLFFFSHASVAAIVHGESFDFFPDSGITRDPNAQGTNNQNENTNTQENSNTNNANSNTNASTSNANTNVNTVSEAEKRTGFDPEDAVIDKPLASSTQETIAAAIMQTIRTNVANGEVTAFKEAVDIDAIAGLIAPEYAYLAQEEQGLSDTERDELMFDYHSTFITNELQNVVDKDYNASMFCGRIREVRTESNNDQILYIVTESISGDHQRVCFIATGDGNNGWMITGITAPKEYVKMIQQGS